MTNSTHLMVLNEGEPLGTIVYDRTIKHIVRQTIGRDRIQICTRISEEPSLVDYVDPETLRSSERLCDVFKIHHIDGDGNSVEFGTYHLPVSEEGKIRS